jgi:hypothetical protein
MENQEYKFYTFLSHAEGGEDEKTARWLRRKLQNCRIPVETITQLRAEENALPGAWVRVSKVPERFSVADKPGKPGKPGEPGEPGKPGKYQGAGKISNLAHYLIVVCSPRGARSERLERGVRDFVEDSKEEYIIPLIIGGEPVGPEESRCYPPSLSAEILGVSLSDGTREETFIRIMARLLRVKFSRLYQRHLRERRRFLIRALAAASIVLALLSCLTGWALYREVEASRRRDEIEGLTRFIADEIKDDTRLPKGFRMTIGEKIQDYNHKSKPISK